MILRIGSLDNGLKRLDGTVDLLRLIFLAKGKSSVLLDGVEVRLSSGMACLIGPGAKVGHDICRSNLYVMEFDSRVWQEFLRFFSHNNQVKALGSFQVIELTEEGARTAQSRIVQLGQEIASGIGENQQKLLFGLLMLEVLSGRVCQFVPIDPARGMLMELNGLLEESFRRERSTRFYARRLGVSPRRLNAMCRVWFAGKSFFSVLMERLLDEAEYRLRCSDEPIKVIAFELGFKSSQNFRMYFVRYRGLSPLEFRKKVSDGVALA